MKPKTKAPAPSHKLKDERAEALQRMTKAELVRTVKKLDANQTKLLNRIAQLEGTRIANVERTILPNPFDADADLFVSKFPWEQ